MTIIKRKGDHLGDEQRGQFIQELIHYFEKERDEKIGTIAAQELLTFFLEKLGAELYNKGIIDAKNTLKTKVEDLQYDLDDLLDT